MKNTLFFLMAFTLSGFLTSLSAQQLNSQMDEFLARMDDATLEELEKELNDGLEGIRMFAGFFEGPDEEIRAFTKEEEKYGHPFKIDTALALKALQQFENIGFQQTFKNATSFIEFEKIDDAYWSKQWMEEGMTETFKPKTIFYKDRRKVSPDTENLEVSFNWERPWGEVAVIDSISVDYYLDYPQKFDSVTLTSKSKKTKYKDGFIKVEKLEKNHIYFTISDAYSKRIIARARNADGKIISFSSSSSSPTSDKNSKEGFTEIVAILEDISAKLKAKKFKDTQALKDYLLKKVAKLEVAQDKDGIYHKKMYFNGNIESIQLYIATKTKLEKVNFTATNNNRFRDILVMQNENNTVLLDDSAKQILKTDVKPLKQLGNQLFLEGETYLYLNTTTKNLDSLEAVKVFETINGLVFIQPTLDNGFFAYDTLLKKVSELEFSNVYDADEEYAHTRIDGEAYYSIDTKGAVAEIEDVSNIIELSEGLLLVKSDQNYGFIAPSGEIVVPCIYKDAELFSEGLAVVMNDKRQYAFIDKQGKLVLPFIYDRANSFENGVALVSHDGAYQLIDSTGAVLVTADGSGYSISGSGLDKTYTFGNKTYDALGNLMP